MPPLKEMLDAARRGEFDLLVLYDFTRLRDLLDPVARSLAAYGVQLYSLAQAVEPQAPEAYDPYASDTAFIMQTFSGLASRVEISNLRRRYRIGVPGRVEKGLHTVGRAPYGYRKPPGHETDPGAVFIQDPAEAAVLLRIKDWFLGGLSLPQISARLTEAGIPSPLGKTTWGKSAVRYLLANSFYSGQVFHGMARIIRDPRTGKRKTIAGPGAFTGPGRHEPLWDEATRQTILNEFKRRHKTYKGRHTHRLSALLRCALHGQFLHANHQRHNRFWYCKGTTRGHWHLVLHEDRALEQLSQKLMDDLRAIQEQIPPAKVPEQSRRLRAAAEDLAGRQERLTDALELGSLAPAVYAERMRVLEKQLAEARRALDEDSAGEERLKARRKNLDALAAVIRDAPDFLARAPAQQVNAMLRAGIEKIVVSEDGGMEIFYR